MRSAVVKLIKDTPALHSAYMALRDLRSYFRYRKAGTFSQHGEDKFLVDWFGPASKGFYLDIGCSHPFRISNTYQLYRQGWTGIVVDPIPHFQALYRRWRRRDTFINAGVGEASGTFTYYELTPSVLSTFDRAYMQKLISRNEASLHKQYEVEIIAINTLFERHVGGRTVDFMTLDVEGLDLSIIRALDFSRFRPRMISVEFNTDSDRDALAQVLGAAGYDCSRIIGCNLFAIEASEAAARGT